MVKRQRSVGLSEDIIKYIEKNKGPFTFSAYLEYLCWKAIRDSSRDSDEENVRDKAHAKRAILRTL